MKTASLAAAAALAAALLALSSCGGEGGNGGGIGGTGSEAPGTLSVSLTDAPACGYDALFVTVERVRLHQDAAAPDADPGWQELPVTPPRRIDLLTLTNGKAIALGQATLPPGRYTQLRLVLARNDGAQPRANALVPAGGAETPFTVGDLPSAGIAVPVDLPVAAGDAAEAVVDFDACRSIVRRAGSGEYGLSPVVSAMPVRSRSGLQVVGQVAGALAHGDTTVSLQRDGVPVKATVPAADGRFVLYPVPEGVYDLVVASRARATAVVRQVPVTPDGPTVVNGPAAPILPPPTSVRSVAGSVTPATATVRARQVLAGTSGVEVAWLPVDRGDGTFGAALPEQPPVVAAFQRGPAPLVFVPEQASAGEYAIEAASAGKRKTATLGAVEPSAELRFTFP